MGIVKCRIIEQLDRNGLISNFDIRYCIQEMHVMGMEMVLIDI